MHFLLSLSAPLSLPALSLVCIPWDITKVTQQIWQQRSNEGSPCSWALPLSPGKNEVWFSLVHQLLLAWLRRGWAWSWGHRGHWQSCRAGTAMTHLRKASLGEKGSCFGELLCRVRDLHLLLHWVISLLVIQGNMWSLAAVSALNRQGRAVVCALGSSLPVSEVDCCNICCSVCDDQVVKCSELAAGFEMGQMDLAHHDPHGNYVCSLLSSFTPGNC